MLGKQIERLEDESEMQSAIPHCVITHIHFTRRIKDFISPYGNAAPIRLFQEIQATKERSLAASG
jgi:hypothetical protein